MDRRRVKMMEFIANVLVLTGTAIILVCSFKLLLGMEKERSAKRKLYEEGKTDYYGNKVDE
jgi:hypothetical protein